MATLANREITKASWFCDVIGVYGAGETVSSAGVRSGILSWMYAEFLHA